MQTAAFLIFKLQESGAIIIIAASVRRETGQDVKWKRKCKKPHKNGVALTADRKEATGGRGEDEKMKAGPWKGRPFGGVGRAEGRLR